MSYIQKLVEVEKDELNIYLKQRIDSVIKKEVTDKLDYLNGLLFHAVPDNMNKITVDWSNENQVNNVKSALTKFSKSDITFNQSTDGQIGLNEKEYSLFLDNSIIETLSTRIVRQTPINFPPKIRYVQVEDVISKFMNYIEFLIDLSNSYSNIPSFTIYVSLVGIKGVVFNYTEKDYTTTIKYPDDTLTFQISNPIEKDKSEVQKSIEEAIHKTLVQFEPVE